MTYPDASSASMVYDANSNLVQLTQPSGTVVQDVFDALDRNTSRAVTPGTGVGGTTAETRTYDALGRVLTNADDDYQLAYQYEVNGLGSLMSSETQSYVGSVTWSKTVTKTHDAVGRTLTEAYPSGTTLHRTWTPIGRLGTVSDGVTTLASFTYWGARPKGATFQNGMTEARTYTGFRGEVQQVLHQTSAQSTVLQLDYAYDANHDRLFERHGGAGSAGDAFAYDRMRRLTTAWMGSATPSSPATAAYTKRIDYVMAMMPRHVEHLWIEELQTLFSIEQALGEGEWILAKVRKEELERYLETSPKPLSP